MYNQKDILFSLFICQAILFIHNQAFSNPYKIGFPATPQISHFRLSQARIFIETSNHLSHLQKTSLLRYSLKRLYCNGFKALKCNCQHFFTSFSPYFRCSIKIPYNKKMRKPLCFPHFKTLLFFPIKSANYLILYISISLILRKISFYYPPIFAFFKLKQEHFLFIQSKSKILII